MSEHVPGAPSVRKGRAFNTDLAHFAGGPGKLNITPGDWNLAPVAAGAGGMSSGRAVGQLGSAPGGVRAQPLGATVNPGGVVKVTGASKKPAVKRPVKLNAPYPRGGYAR